MRFEEKVAIVTGATSGIGEAAARLLAAEGARVVVTGRRPDLLDDIAGDLGGLAVAGDMADAHHPGAVVRSAVDAFGGVDVLVANAAEGYPASVADAEDERWDRTFAVNVSGPMRLARAALPSMLGRGGGSIVLVGSVMGLFGSAESAAYGTSKAALLGLVRSIAVDFGPRGVRANAVCPAWVRTPMGDRTVEDLAASLRVDRDEAYRLATRHVPLRRAAEAEEIARCIAFLACDDASIVTGAALVADGGQTAVDLGGIVFDDAVEETR